MLLCNHEIFDFVFGGGGGVDGPARADEYETKNI